ncbi:MAG: ABC transporter substrate-binding protein, partial [Anaerolineae bacterium]|nr:ABC transporter substrate-binding protein [Anaerolineae bacterium]
LRKGVLFHDIEGIDWGEGGREVKAQDIIWSAHISATDDETISQHPEIWDGVVGIEAYRSGETDTLEGIKAIDDYTVEITLQAPNRLFFAVGPGGFSIVPQEAYEQLEDFGNRPVGTGPFMFVEWLKDDHITLKANPEYWQEGIPKIAGIKFINVADANTELLMYRQNDLDVMHHFPSGQRQAIAEEFADDYHQTPGLNVRYFGFKMSVGFFAENPLVRKAFAHAFNRELVWNELMEGARFPADLGVLPPAMPASTPATVYEYNLDKAAELLAEAGFPNGEGMPEITLYVFASAKDELSFPVLQQDLATLGVTLKIEIEDNSTYWSHIGEDDVIFFLSGWSAGIPDPADVLNYLFMDERDDTKYNNPEVNDLLTQAMSEFDADKRLELYQQAHDLIMEDCPWIVSAYSKVTWLQKPWVKNFNPTGGGVYTTWLWEVEIDTAMMPQ